jgi:hypothetical protein
MTARAVPRRHWRSYGDDPLPTGGEALDEPFSAVPSWFMRITCDRCGKDRVISETHATAAQRDMPIREIIERMRHDGCGGRAGKVELVTGIDGASSHPGAEDRAAGRRLTKPEVALVQLRTPAAPPSPARRR